MIAVVDPLVGHPVRAGMGRTFPAARNPDVMVSVPAVIAVDPNEPTLGRISAALNDRRGRTDAK
jgi:hypothetical protein